MNDLHIKGDIKAPSIDFEYGSGNLVISGRSWPEHALNVYGPAFEWIGEYLKAPKPLTRVKVALEYFNTSSSKVVLELLKRFEPLYASGGKVEIQWLYESDDMDLLDEGVSIKESLSIPVELVGVDDFGFDF